MRAASWDWESALRIQHTDTPVVLFPEAEYQHQKILLHLMPKNFHVRNSEWEHFPLACDCAK